MGGENKSTQGMSEKLSTWDVVHAVNLAITTFITYALTTAITPLLAHRPAQPVGILLGGDLGSVRIPRYAWT